ncbi:hypothetical protein [Telluribacter sp.]|jgi:hypothetical protein|uniref:hypothetical protein n=1 Tax=Telluribacter sp. TaxID=1978767 RepID=UPI002E0EC045|nr:hypothetical protein [Telluribacter sp.]
MSLNLYKYVVDLRTQSLNSEIGGINGIPFKNKGSEKEEKEKNKRKRDAYGYRIVIAMISMAIVCSLKTGFEDVFVSYFSSVLSILVGLFITALVFSFDKFYTKADDGIKIYNIDVNEESVPDVDKSYTIAVKNNISLTAGDKVWDTQSHNYSLIFAYVTGYNIVLCIIVIVLLALNTLFEHELNINIFKYYLDIKDITLNSLGNLFLVVFNIIHRFLVLYWIGFVLYRTIFLVSSMVSYMTTKIRK